MACLFQQDEHDLHRLTTGVNRLSADNVRSSLIHEVTTVRVTFCLTCSHSDHLFTALTTAAAAAAVVDNNHRADSIRQTNRTTGRLSWAIRYLCSVVGDLDDAMANNETANDKERYTVFGSALCLREEQWRQT